MQIKVDFSKTIGEIKPLHGVNNGPVCYGTFVDVTKYYKDIHMPYVRIHDPNWPNPREVDIYAIFRDFDADLDASESYDFRTTDDYIKSIVNTGASIVYRLGVSIEHTKIKYHTSPPKNYEKWAKICCNIIRHYNMGWNNGFHYDIQYWEIWNEPDGGDNMWSGTPEQYFLLYETASKAIKSMDPKLKVGGFAATSWNYAFTEKFFEYCSNRNLTLDFFSWHTYTLNPETVVTNACMYERMLDKYGYKNAESHMNEWSYINLGEGMNPNLFTGDGEYTRKEVFDRAKNEEGASFAASILIAMQDLKIDMANYYDGQPTSMFCGLFDYHGVPQKTYYAFKAFSEIAKCGKRVATDCINDKNGDGIYYCAGEKCPGKEYTILLSNFSQNEKDCSIIITGIPKDSILHVESYFIDKQRNFQPDFLLETVKPEESTLQHMPPFSVCLKKVKLY